MERSAVRTRRAVGAHRCQGLEGQRGALLGPRAAGRGVVDVTRALGTNVSVAMPLAAQAGLCKGSEHRRRGYLAVARALVSEGGALLWTSAAQRGLS